jgi:preprotein translocase YajC subunit
MEIILLAFVMALTFTGYYAMVLFPRQRDFQKRQLMARELVEGDEIVTYGGIIGKVKQIDSAKGVAMVEIANGVTIRLVIAAMMHRYDPDEIAKNAQMGLANQNDATSTT